MWWYLALAILAFIGLCYAVLHKAMTAGDCTLPDDDGEDYP